MKIDTKLDRKSDSFTADRSPEDALYKQLISQTKPGYGEESSRGGDSTKPGYGGDSSEDEGYTKPGDGEKSPRGGDYTKPGYEGESPQDGGNTKPGIEKADFKSGSHYKSDELLKRSFDRDDVDKDGYLTPKDKIGKMLGDTNNDGSVDKEEFMSFVDPSGTPFNPSEREQSFYRNDRNHDGLYNILDQIPADFNGDGKLSFDEIKENFYKAYPPDDSTWGGING